MKVYKIKYVKKLTGTSRKEIKKLLRSKGIIDDTWAVTNAQGFVVELNDIEGNISETTLLFTQKGIDLINSMLKEVS